MKQNFVVLLIGIALGFSLALTTQIYTSFFVPPVQVGVADVEPVFSPGNQDVIVNLVQSSHSSLELEVYTFSSTILRDELIAAHERGVDVKVILDSSISSNVPMAKALLAKGVQVMLSPKRFSLVHSKFLVIDKEVVFVGSNNWTFHSFNLNREASVKLRSSAVAARFLEVFYSDWNDGIPIH